MGKAMNFKKWIIVFREEFQHYSGKIQHYCLVYFNIIIWFIFPLSHSCDHQNKFLVL